MVTTDSSTVALTLAGGVFSPAERPAWWPSTASPPSATWRSMPAAYPMTATDGSLASAAPTSFSVYLLNGISSCLEFPNEPLH